MRKLRLNRQKRRGRSTIASKTVGGLPVLGGLLFLSCMVIYGYLLLTGHQYIYLDVGSDTLHSFYSVYCWAVEHIRTGDFSFWSFEIGMGGSIFNYASVLLDPFALPVLVTGLVGGTKTIAGALLVAQFMRIFACGFLCYGFLGYFDILPKSRIVASYCCAFSGFMMLWGQHYWLATALVWVLLELYLLERERQTGRVSAQTALATAWMLMQSPYIGYMTLLFCGVYMLLRLFYEAELSWGSFWRQAWPMIASILLGICISALVFLPTAYLILKVSSRLDSGKGIIETFWAYFTGGYSRSELAGIGLRFFSNNAQGIGSDYHSYDNYYEVPQFFFSSAFLLCLAQMAWRGLRNIANCKFSVRRKLVMAASAGLISFLIFNPSGSLIFNAFAYPFGRYTFVLMPVWALAMGLTLTELERGQWNLPVVITAAVVEIAVYLWCAWRNGEATPAGMLMLFLAGTVFVFICGVWGLRRKGIRLRRLASYAIAAAIWLSVTADGFCTVNLRGLIETNSSVLTREGRAADTMRALDYLDKIDSGLYRVEKTYTDVSEVMDSMVFGYNGVSGYNSMLSGAMQKFHQELWPGLVGPGGWFRQYYTAVSEDWVMSSLCGIKYLLTDEPEQEYGPYYEKIAEFGSVSVFRNTMVDSIGFLTSFAVEEENLETLSQEERSALVRKAAVVEELDEQSFYYVAELPETEVQEEVPDIWDSSAQIQMDWEDGELKGTVTAEKAGLLILTVPLEQGWTVYVDGNKREAVAVDYGFTGIYMDAGMHEISMQYEPPMLVSGMFVSAAGMFILAGVYWTQRKRGKNGTRKQEK